MSELHFDFFDDRFAVVLERPPTRAEFTEAVRSEVVLLNVVHAPRLIVKQCSFDDAYQVWVDGWLRGAGLGTGPERGEFITVLWALETPGRQQPDLMAEAHDYMRRARAHGKNDCGSLWAGRPIV